MSKNQLPTVDIKGKEYVLVKDRVLAFREKYPEGCIETEILSDVISDKIVIRAIISKVVINQLTNSGATDTKYILATGHSQATVGDGYINKTAALENAETSAVGRALAFLGIGVIESIASADEIHKATGSKKNIKAEVDLAPNRSPDYQDKPSFGPGSDEEQD